MNDNCPNCKSSNVILSSPWWGDGNTVHTHGMCDDCETEYQVTYQLTVVDIEVAN
jgi:transcriptional regulator NrdR family protein